MTGADAALLIAAGVGAGFLNVVAGGGSLLTLPALLACGVPATVANGSNRIAILASTTTATGAYIRNGTELGLGDRWLVVPLLLGALTGAAAATRLSNDQMETTIGMVMLAMAGWMLSGRSVQTSGVAGKGWRGLGACVAGAYGGFIQAGVGVVLLAVLSNLFGRTLQQANAAKVALVAVYTVPILCVFALAGQVNVVAGCTLAVGTTIGAQLGVRVVTYVDERILRIVIVALVTASGIWVLVR